MGNGHHEDTTSSAYHTPVMVREVLRFLVTADSGTYVDATLGGGGHAAALLEQLGPEARLIGIDTDPEAVATARSRLGGDSRFTAVQARFSELAGVLQEVGAHQCNGVLADFGVSSHQVDAPERGFSYLQDGPLDMRMNPAAGRSAAELLQQIEEVELASILHRYGEERRARKLARAICRARRERPITRTSELAEIVASQVPPPHRIKALARVFQALRIAVNEELREIAAFLPAAFSVLQPGGRMVVLTYHSLEDRLVKTFFREKARGCICPPEVVVCQCGHTPEVQILTRKVVRATEEEVKANPRARSARLRAAQKLG